jgi:predicted nucleotidyltransferase
VIPELVDGVLPEGVHECTMDEVAERFGRFQRTDRRIRLTERLRRYLADARLTGTATAVVLDGSYVSGRDEPGDIDLILVLRADYNPTGNLRPIDYNVRSKRMGRRLYGFDIVSAPDQGEAYRGYIEFFSGVRPDDPRPYTSRPRKGLLRIPL